MDRDPRALLFAEMKRAERYRGLLLSIADGHWPRTITRPYLNDGTPHMKDRCWHGIEQDEHCQGCLSEYIEAHLGQEDD